MKKILNNLAFFDRTLLILIMIIVMVFTFTIVLFLYTKNVKEDNAILKNQITEMQRLRKQVSSLKSIVQTKEQKMRVTGTTGVVSSIELILKNLNLEASKIKPLDKKKINDYFEEKADVEINNTDLNSIVNLIFKIENSPDLIKINSASIKTTFEDPEKFIVTMSLSYVSKG